MGLNLSLSGVSKKYNGKPVLQDCSVTFSGGVSVLMGPNGCGKSTLLRICALLEQPEGGNILYSAGGTALPQDLPLKRRITLVLPRVGVFNTTVFKNAAYGLRVRGRDRREVEQQTMTVLEAVGLASHRHQNALTLSSGETQRLGLARAMAIGPDMLFLDEPTASIDEINSRIVEEIILALKKDASTTIVMTTHDREQADRLADRVILMRDGTILS